VINGNMIAGFALVAWPAEYGNSGIMTSLSTSRVGFIRRIWIKTGKLAPVLKQYDPTRPGS